MAYYTTSVFNKNTGLVDFGNYFDKLNQAISNGIISETKTPKEDAGKFYVTREHPSQANAEEWAAIARDHFSTIDGWVETIVEEK